MILRPYQGDAFKAILEGFREFRKQLLVLPTGGGKTVVFSKLSEAMLPGRTLILAHREELVDQAIEKLHRATGIFAGKEKAEFTASLQDPVVVASVQTMGRRLHKWPTNHFSLIVCDEAHHAVSESWQTVLRHFDAHAKVLGVTATPDRGDKKTLGQYFQNIPAEVALLDLIKQGYLSRIAVKSVPLAIDLSSVRQTAGDYDANGLGDALAPYLPAIARGVREHAASRRTLVFLPLIATSQAFVQACRAVGLAAEHVDGESPDRREKLAAFARGEFNVLSNAMLLAEGFDDPGIECVVILRPTRSRPLYAQMVGRGTRVAPGKEKLLLLDFLWLHEKHNLIRPAHLVATSDEEAAAITALAQKPGCQSEDASDLEALAGEVRHQRENTLRQELQANARRKAKSGDAIEFCLSLHATDAADWQDTMGWHCKPVSEGQRAMLLRHGIDPGTVRSRGHASAIIELILTRRKLHLATPKQMKYLRQFGHPSPETATFDQASRFLDVRFNPRPKEVVA